MKSETNPELAATSPTETKKPRGKRAAKAEPAPEPESPASPKPGRARKPKATATESSEPASPTEPKQARGKGRKLKLVTDESEAEAPAASEPQPERAPSEPASKRRPRKPQVLRCFSSLRSRSEPASKRRSRKPPQEASIPAAESARAPEPTPEPSEGAASQGGRESAQERAGSRKPDTVTVSELAERYLSGLERDGRSDSTISAYRCDLQLFAQVVGAATAIGTLRPEHIARFNEHQIVTHTRAGVEKAPPTVARSRRVARLALDFAVDEGLLLVSPCCEHEPVEIES